MTRHKVGGGRFFLAAGISAVLSAVAILRHEPPAPRPASVSASQFSAARAGEILHGLIRDGTPHPVGSEANARVRERVIAQLKLMGYEPIVQQAFVCGRSGVCATVKNVLARRPGATGGRAVMVCAHYDSVGAGPGASDDGMGVAALLEIARIVRQDPPTKNPIVFLIDDGEEAGLLGAEAFASEHPWAREIGAVVNLDNRGTSGASFLFETSDENRWLVDLAARSIPRPATSSLFYTVYKRLPNDTDLTVFREHGMAGVNFAAIGDEPRYHTALDDLRNASLSTLQHHGDNALAMTRALARSDLSAPHRGNAVFFDLFGAGIVLWPEAATPALAGVALLLLAIVIFRERRAGTLSAGMLFWGLAGGLSMPLLAAAAGLGASRLLGAAGATPVAWIAHPGWLLCAMWALGLLSAGLVAVAVGRRAGAQGLWAGVWTGWSVIALLLAFEAPGVSFLFLVPAAAAALLGLAASRSSAWRGAAAVLPACLAAFFWLPLAWVLYDALGCLAAGIIAAAVGLWAAAISPTFVLVSDVSRRAILGALAAAAVIAFAGQLFARPFSPRVPERMSIVWHENADTRVARWLLSPDSNRLSEAAREAAGCSKESVSAYPWSGSSRAFVADAAGLNLPAPEILVREDAHDASGRRIRATLRSARGALVVFLALSDPARTVVRIGGKPIGPMTARALARRGGWRIVTCATVPAEGIDVEILWTGDQPIDFILADESPGLPRGSERFVRARGAAAVPSQDGDSTVVTSRVTLRDERGRLGSLEPSRAYLPGSNTGATAARSTKEESRGRRSSS